MRLWSQSQALLLVALLSACATSPSADIAALAEQDPLPYSVLITGGAFVQSDNRDGAPAGVLSRTFGNVAGANEAIPLDKLTETLRAARVFVAQARHTADADIRRRLAAHTKEAYSDPALKAVLEEARSAGHDFLLVVEKIQDSEVKARGINDRWPFTLGAWLFALGAFIPDRTYESSARLYASVRDVRSGRLVFGPTVVEAGPVDLNMFERASFGGFMQSFLVPPFWTTVNSEKVVEAVRKVSIDRLKVALARKMKAADTRVSLESFGPAHITVRRAGNGVRVGIDAQEAVSFVRMRLDLQPLTGRAFVDFEKELRASVREDGGRFRYDAELRGPLRGNRLQVLVQTVTASVASTSINLSR